MNLVVADMFDAGRRVAACAGGGRSPRASSDRRSRAALAPRRVRRPAVPLPSIPPFLPPLLPLGPGLLGDGFMHLLELARRRVVQQGAAVVPAAATLYCMGLEVAPARVQGFDFSEMDKYR